MKNHHRPSFASCAQSQLPCRGLNRPSLKGLAYQDESSTTLSCFVFELGPSGEGSRAAPAKEVVQDRGDAREPGQQAA